MKLNFNLPFGGNKPGDEPKIKRSTSARITKKARISAPALGSIQGRPQRPGLLRFTMRVLYANLYVLGVTLLRRRLRLRRRLKLFRARAAGRLGAGFAFIGRGAARIAKGFWTRFCAPFARIRRTYLEVKPQVQVKRAMGKLPFAEFFAVVETVFRLIFKVIATAFNYVAPVAAAVFVIFFMGSLLIDFSRTVYTLTYQGELLGYVQNQSEFYAAAQDVRARTTIDGEDAFEIFSPDFELVRLSVFEQQQREGEIPRGLGPLERDELADIMIRMSGSTVEEAYGLYIDGEFFGALRDKDVILDEFDRMRNRSRSGKPNEQVKFAKSIQLKPGLYLEGSIAPEFVILGEITRNETAEEIYVAQEGDTPTGIADKLGMPYAMLKELNPDIETDLFEGTEIITQVAKPFLAVETSYTEVLEEPVPYETVETENATYARGYREVDQSGRNGSRRVTYTVTAVNGVELERQEMDFEMLREPVEERVTIGVNNPVSTAIPVPSLPSGSSGGDAPATERKPGGFIWPVGGSGGRITCYLNGYAGHTGVDISVRGGYGTPILASASGTVVLAKNSGWGYGRHIAIDHGNGYATWYAHNTELYVSVGDKVGQGQIIAGMGATGNAYGVHLHFEVRQNGRIMNPTNYIGG